MSTLRNHVQLIGRLGADAEIKTTNQGKPYANLRMATNEYVKNSKGEWIENTQWHSLIVWGEMTKVLETSGKKGNQLLAQGTLQYREYTDAQGVQRNIAEVRVSKLMPFDNVVKTKAGQEEVGVGAEEDLPF